MSVCEVGSVAIGGDRLVLIAGPCLAECEQLCHDVAGSVGELCRELDVPYIFKASFDKANRTSGSSPRGLGLGALRWIAEAGRSAGVPTTTDVHLPEQCRDVAEVVDLLQIPAFLCRQTDLLEAAASTGRPVNVKKGQFLAPWDTGNIVAKLRRAGARGIVLTERGTSFGYNALVVDMYGLEVMRAQGVPVCFDGTHSTQRPGGAGTSSGGVRDAVPALCRAAAAVGIDALFLEVHPDPDKALSDPATQWPLQRLRELLEPVLAVREAARR
ncbi:MAG: 3-deoxy-8-phosphooctulonate synthase [Fimbriimonadales bacterium]|nr:3-deoxy-8-phosphooctulonate synthase [Fimbriimonadales bacterium]